MASFIPIKISGIDHRQTHPIREGSDRFKFVFRLKAEGDQIPEQWIELFNDEFGGRPELHWASVQSKGIVVTGYGYTGVTEAEITEMFDSLKDAINTINDRYREILEEEEAKRNARQAVIVRLQLSLNFD
jgi:hypothetical protein